MKSSTLALHDVVPAAKGPIVQPVVRSSAFQYQRAEELAAVFSEQAPGYLYSRLANPTVSTLEQRLSTLEGGIGGVAFSSGMAAISGCALALTQKDSKVICSSSVFGGTASLLLNVLSQFGVETVFFKPSQESRIEEFIDNRTRFIFTEVIGNPSLDVVDLEKLAALKGNVPLIVDSTLTPPTLFNPKIHGADIVVHSTTKFISGHGRALGGVVIDTGNYDWNTNCEKYNLQSYVARYGHFGFIRKLKKQYLADLGACMTADTADITLMGLESLHVRVERSSTNAMILANYLNNRLAAAKVRYVGLASDPFFFTASKLFHRDFGNVITMDLGSQDKAFELINRLQIAVNGPNVGDVRTLVIHPWTTIGCMLNESERKASGITPGLIRISVGIEDANNLIADFEQAIATKG